MASAGDSHAASAAITTAPMAQGAHRGSSRALAMDGVRGRPSRSDLDLIVGGEGVGVARNARERLPRFAERGDELAALDLHHGEAGLRHLLRVRARPLVPRGEALAVPDGVVVEGVEDLLATELRPGPLQPLDEEV